MQTIKIISSSLVAFISFLSFSCSRPIDCSSIKNGKFYYHAKKDRRKILIERTDSLQIEIDTKDNSIIRSKVIWQDDCKFQVFVNSLNEKKLSVEDSIYATIPATIEILEVKSGYYTCLVKFSTSKKYYELKDTIYFQK